MKDLLSKVLGTRRRKVAAGIVTSVMVATSAVAAWQIIQASGTANGKVGSLIAPTITGAASPVADLYPNNNTATGTLSMVVNNSNPSTLYLKGFDVSKASITGGTAQCDWTDPNASGGQYWNVRQHLRFNGHIYGPAGDEVTFPGVFVPAFSIPVVPGVSTIQTPTGFLGLNENTPSACQGTQINGFQIINAVFSTAP